MTYGTSYFYSFPTACRYYRAQESPITTQELRAIVQRKLDEGLIHIGKPPIRDGETLSLTDAGTRYVITDGTK